MLCKHKTVFNFLHTLLLLLLCGSAFGDAGDVKTARLILGIDKDADGIIDYETTAGIEMDSSGNMNFWDASNVTSYTLSALRHILLLIDENSGVVDLTSGTIQTTYTIVTDTGAGAGYTWANDYVIYVNSADHVDITLPDALTHDGKWAIIKRWGAGGVDIERTGADAIDGGTSVGLAAQHDSIKLQANGALSAWCIH